MLQRTRNNNSAEAAEQALGLCPRWQPVTLTQRGLAVGAAGHKTEE